MPKIKFGRNRRRSDVIFLGREISGFTAPVVIKIFPRICPFFTRGFLCWLERCGSPGSSRILIGVSRSPTERVLTPSNRINSVIGVSSCRTRSGLHRCDCLKLNLCYSRSTEWVFKCTPWCSKSVQKSFAVHSKHNAPTQFKSWSSMMFHFLQTVLKVPCKKKGKSLGKFLPQNSGKSSWSLDAEKWCQICADSFQISFLACIWDTLGLGTVSGTIGTHPENPFQSLLYDISNPSDFWTVLALWTFPKSCQKSW